MIFPLRDAAHSLTEIEDEIGAAAIVEPPHVVADGNALNLMVERAEDSGDVVDCLHHRRDVLGSPVVGAGIIEDDDLHAEIAVGAWRGAACCASTSRPVIRRHAIRTTSWISSSYP